MARLPFIDPVDEPDALRPVFDQLRATRGRVPGMYRLLAHQHGFAARQNIFDLMSRPRGEFGCGG